MLKDKFLDAIDECPDENITIVTYYKDEMYGRRTMPVISIEDYDNEIVIRGEKNDYILLNCGNIDMKTGEENEIEFLFTIDDFTTAVEFIA